MAPNSDDAAHAPEGDALAELAWLSSALRAHLEWQMDAGTLGLEPASAELRATRGVELLEDTSNPATVPSSELRSAPEPPPQRREQAQFAPGSTQEPPAPRREPERFAPELREQAGFTPELREQARFPAANTLASSSEAPALTQPAGERALSAAVGTQRGAPGDARLTYPRVEAPLPAPPTHGSPLPPSAGWEREAGTAQPEVKLPPALPVEILEERQAALAVLAERVRPCSACRLSEHRTQTVFARGSGSSGLCFVGEGPGADEDLQGEPFVGRAGELLDKMIAAMGLPRDSVYVCNVVKCRPPNNRKPAPEELYSCRPFLTEQLELVAPRVIVALGATAVEGLLGSSGGITRIRGRWRLYKGRIPVMPTFHPAYLLRNPRAKREVWEDLRSVMNQLGLSRAPAGG